MCYINGLATHSLSFFNESNNSKKNKGVYKSNEILSNAPEKLENYFVVPKVVE